MFTNYRLLLNTICVKLIEKRINYTTFVRKFCFKNDLPIEKLYQLSKLKILTPPPPTQKENKFSGYIPINKLEISYSRSSGPGGQNVNCVNTKVDLRFHVESAEWMPENVRKRMLEEHRNKITKEGYYVIKSDVTRSQQMNLADALEKLRCFILELEKKAFQPTEESLEKMRRMKERANRERLLLKRHHSQIKEDRQSPIVDLTN